MQNSSLRRAATLDPSVRAALEALLGRALQADESVSVRTYRPKPAPDGEARATAYRELLERADRTAERANDMPETQIDAAIDEAAAAVRRNSG